MNLTIDIGNTLAKMAVIHAGQVVDTYKFERLTVADLELVFQANPGIGQAIMISTQDDFLEIEEFVQQRVERFIRFDHTVQVPIKNSYKTPHTLGCDRLAAAVGAATVYPKTNVMIVDFGTAITIDVVTQDGEFVGGNISLGATSRLRALSDYTKKLPLLKLSQQTELLGTTTESAIQSGVVNGIVYEIEGYFCDLSKKYSDLRIIFTGGDANFFAKRFKNPIFATYDLVSYGLNRILEYNAR